MKYDKIFQCAIITSCLGFGTPLAFAELATFYLSYAAGTYILFGTFYTIAW